MAFINDLTTLLAADTADTDLVYVGKPGDPDPDRVMTVAQLRELITGALLRPAQRATSQWFLQGAMPPNEPFFLSRFAANIGSFSTRSLAVDEVRLSPFILGRDMAIERIGAWVRTAGVGGTVIRATIREATDLGLPGDIIESVEVAGDATGAQVEPLSSITTLYAGRPYWAQLQASAAVTVTGATTSEPLWSLGVQSGGTLGYWSVVRTGVAYASGAVPTWTWDAAERNGATPPFLAATL